MSKSIKSNNCQYNTQGEYVCDNGNIIENMTNKGLKGEIGQKGSKKPKQTKKSETEEAKSMLGELKLDKGKPMTNLAEGIKPVEKNTGIIPAIPLSLLTNVTNKKSFTLKKKKETILMTSTEKKNSEDNKLATKFN